MDIEGEFVFEGSRQEVWELLFDPEVLKKTMPGVQEWKEVGPYEYEARMKIGIAAVSGTYIGKLTSRDLNPPESYTLIVEGSGGPGFVRGQGDINLIEQYSKTIMKYKGEVLMGGMLASVGQRMMSGVAKMIIDQSLKAMARELTQRLAERQQAGTA